MSSKAKYLILIISLVVIGFGSYMFVKFSNDHKECSSTQEVTIAQDGSKVVSTKHVCKEKYSL